MESLNILHLSDLHIGNFRYENPATLAIKISDILSDQARKVDIVIVSGDIFDGRSKNIEKDIEMAVVFFNTLIAQLVSKNISAGDFDVNSILFIPGNHDLKRNLGKEYEKYDAFIDKFYHHKNSSKVTVIDKYNFICDFAEKKIAVLGFNSCKVQADQIREEDLKWIDDLNLLEFNNNAVEIRKIIKKHKEAENKWDDFGYVDPIEMDNLFIALRKEIPNYHEYNMVATFHHHFYPFPEIVNRYPDSSFIRNYTDVLDKFQRYKIQLVLHGHKHLSIQRAITDNKYFENPESIIYVLSAGSIGCKDVYNPSFQWIRVYDRSSSKLADGEKYDFKDEELDNIKEFTLPPQKKEEKSVSLQLVDALQSENSEFYTEYKKITDDFEQTLQDNGIDKIIEVVSSLITVFNDIKIELRKNPEIIFILLLSLHYRVIFLKQLHFQKQEFNDLLERLRDAMIRISGNKPYTYYLIDFLSSSTNRDLGKHYQLTIKNVLGSEKRVSAYTSIALFFTDLFLNISQYGEFYFEKEKLNHKINIKLEKALFYKNIPSDSISLEANIDRRAIILNFKCKDPTVHKVAVLIVKDFEMRLDKIEESLKEIKLKLYYILPKVQPQKYDLENFHFDAYIPTLLPLLTGDNLYKQKEVFIRELVQNAIDATLLRKKIKPDEKFDTSINIEVGTEFRESKPVKYFKIIDHGIGMSKFTIERYFTSIGRSFYVSEEFDELRRENNIQYDPISNFGIGFLSSFMICKEVLVKTKSVIEEDADSGLEIEIPNYDGCFFIREIYLDKYGTEITLYEDDRLLFNFDRFGEYINEVFLGLPVDINVHFKDKPGKDFKIESYRIQQQMLSSLQKSGNPIFYVPISEEKKQSTYLPWDILISSNIETLNQFGFFFDFEHWTDSIIKPEATIANQGLKISEAFVPAEMMMNSDIPLIYINYPSSLIQLDVAREKVVTFKGSVDFKDIPTQLTKQIMDFLIGRSELLLKTTLNRINTINYLAKGILLSKMRSKINLESYALKITKIHGGIQIAVVKIKDIPDLYDDKKICYWSYSELSDIEAWRVFILNLYSFFIKNNKSVYRIYNKLRTNWYTSIKANSGSEDDKGVRALRIVKILESLKYIKLPAEQSGLVDKIEKVLDVMTQFTSQIFYTEFFDINFISGSILKNHEENHNIGEKMERFDVLEMQSIVHSLSENTLINEELFLVLLVCSMEFDSKKRYEYNSSPRSLLCAILVLKSIIFKQLNVANYSSFDLKLPLRRLLDNSLSSS
ncbi:metallophosphoesterase [Chitinophaga sp. GbtcB8]|uniref:metallophosphoesterase n=1 Tax=Chitinophaga sp. GbtcB8 TaxID=2824753 RepID=UPI001C2FAF4C|nr:metallophosphoesterase [Chitinophaga sp. GbtcB8]